MRTIVVEFCVWVWWPWSDVYAAEPRIFAFVSISREFLYSSTSSQFKNMRRAPDTLFVHYFIIIPNNWYIWVDIDWCPAAHICQPNNRRRSFDTFTHFCAVVVQTMQKLKINVFSPLCNAIALFLVTPYFCYRYFDDVWPIKYGGVFHYSLLLRLHVPKMYKNVLKCNLISRLLIARKSCLRWLRRASNYYFIFGEHNLTIKYIKLAISHSSQYILMIICVCIDYVLVFKAFLDHFVLFSVLLEMAWSRLIMENQIIYYNVTLCGRRAQCLFIIIIIVYWVLFIRSD